MQGEIDLEILVNNLDEESVSDTAGTSNASSGIGYNTVTDSAFRTLLLLDPHGSAATLVHAHALVHTEVILHHGSEIRGIDTTAAVEATTLI